MTANICLFVIVACGIALLNIWSHHYVAGLSPEEREQHEQDVADDVALW